MIKEEFDRQLKEYTHECPSCNCGMYKVFEANNTTLREQIIKYIKSKMNTAKPLYPPATPIDLDTYYSQYTLNQIGPGHVFINSPLLGHGVGIPIEKLIEDL